MNKKVNLEEKIAKLNAFCNESKGKSFTGAELCEALMGLGFTKTIAGNIAQKCFPYEKMGLSRLYEMPKTPIYIGVLSSIYKQKAANNKKYYHKKDKTSESPVESPRDLTSEAWDILIKAGKVRQKLNIAKLKKEFPMVYVKCLEYEIINEN